MKNEPNNTRVRYKANPQKINITIIGMKTDAVEKSTKMLFMCEQRQVFLPQFNPGTLILSFQTILEETQNPPSPSLLTHNTCTDFCGILFPAFHAVIEICVSQSLFGLDFSESFRKRLRQNGDGHSNEEVGAPVGQSFSGENRASNQDRRWHSPSRVFFHGACQNRLIRFAFLSFCE
jgi:hypothetical protein